jgi:pimeloyl-ACP methyl ester carboxylesterase
MSKYFVPTARPAGYRSARSTGDRYGETALPDWREVDWRAHMHSAEIDGRPVNYVDIGSGEREPIVFVHGLGGQWQNWLQNIPRAARERRVVALDLPGFGLSAMPRDEITISGYGRVVDTLCDRLGLGRVDVVGNSMGGYIAAEVAIQFPGAWIRSCSCRRPASRVPPSHTPRY